MVTSMGVISVLLLIFLYIQIIEFCFCSADSSSSVACIQRERQALLSFKQSLVDPPNRLSSWTGEDCCKWEGIFCDKITGHVLELHLQNPYHGYETKEEDYKLGGKINSSCLELKHLKYLDLSLNGFQGIHIPKFFGSMKSLRYLNLSNAGFGGMIPHQLGNISSLRYLDLGSSTISRTELRIENMQWLSCLSSLQYLDMSVAYLGKAYDWLQVSMIFEGPIPGVLRNMSHLKFLNLVGNSFDSTIPSWLYDLSGLEYLNLSYNYFHGTILSAVGNLNSLTSLYMVHNALEGSLPRTLGNLRNLRELDLSFNKTWQRETRTDEEISLKILDLSKNLLSGELPDCWMNWKLLRVVRLGNNNLTENIPNSMGSLYRLLSLHLRNNSLSGVLRSTLQNCTKLQTVDLGENEFSGSIPTWIGKSLSKLLVFGIRSDKFNGDIPPELCHLSSLQILDLADNNLSGSIPQCFNNFSAMATNQNSSLGNTYSFYSGKFPETALLVTKGREFEYSYTLTLVTSMDLSGNSLSGVIPEELTSVIPQSMSNLTLSHFNLSYNSLSGRIPSSTQIQSLNADSFIGNPELCGPPLTKNCAGDESEMLDDGGKDGDWFDMESFSVSMALGFVVGFWGVCGHLLFKKSWRYAYCWFLDDMICKLRGSNK
ncbi:hypothetical protein HHK36_000223 [Tetracentron sinense]|uniref:Leucine-rich repeat-containing N-terminal plant-type domain-containing protein n=1 Tax=Tetracentron sinense TaxID=13715 RepID=A0A835DTS9_TETSI|nr:hypothetical protein HHK36_000223 [Tetracentron sinense]